MDAVYTSVQIGLLFTLCHYCITDGKIILPSSSVIWIFDSTFAELEFLSPISSVIKRCQICKSASTTVSKKDICYIQIVYEKRSLNVSKRSEQLSFPTYVSAFADENM
ncbi:hypothetical protein T05_7324 [Trichinella murrelli]|uniref:Uncharacterized protein n=2 Tax=Trichinella TaxID=6333 RepID=A0A0V0UBC1_9BILA|nr:hypothetical protein T05_7324 [Trichinella murrelli]